MLNNRLNKNNKGVTLIEVIAVVAVLGVVMAAVTGFMISGTKMSARVSGKATDSMKEQTAVEFINRRIWETQESVSVDEDRKNDDSESRYYNYHEALELGGTTAIMNGTDPKTQKPAVVYMLIDSQKQIVICPGQIFFDRIDSNTVTYYLNDEKHVVHLRVAPQG